MNGLLAATACVFGLSAVSPASASLITSGDISPATDPGTWTTGTDVLIGNTTANGTLSLDGGTRLSVNRVNLGFAAGKAGTVSIDGSGSQLTNGQLLIGVSGNGTLTVTNGGSVSTLSSNIGSGAGSVGLVTVNGANSKWVNAGGVFNVGNFGTGTLNISNGGAVDSGTSPTTIGNGSGSSGSVNVDGTGSAWTIGNSVIIGNSGSGTLAITNGAKVTANGGTVGSGTLANGTIAIDGPGSQWSSASLGIGAVGKAKLSLSNGGTAIVTGVTSVGALGQISFGANGGTLTTGGLSVAASQLSGTGSINTSGIVSDVNLIFDAKHGINQTFGLNGITVNLSLNGSNGLGAGYLGTGSLIVTDGVTINSNGGTLGSRAGSTGTGSVIGVNSMWVNSGALTVGSSGAGVFSIMEGAGASNTSGTIANVAGSSGKVTVDGAGSQWTNSATLTVGKSGSGILSVGDGGAVSAASLAINASSLLKADLGTGSSVTIGGGTGAVTNNGSIRLAAGAGTASGNYTPIAYGTMTGTGSVQALGGIWDGAAHTVTVSDAATAAAGETATLDLSTTQRLLVTDPTTGDQVGLGFKGASAPTSLSFSASEASGAEQSALQGLLAPGQSVLSAWDFTPGTGYTSGDPVYLSLGVGSGFKLADLAIWRFDGSLWSLFAANDLAYDNQFASFTATGFSSYAVVGPAAVPVPAAVWLFGSALAGLGMMRRKNAA